jgi:prolyl-tRNA editing enzyme YbaK/EbsC (Cys-tRNA(Pro) deacylase)
MQPLTPVDVKAALDAVGLGHIEITTFNDSTATSELAAQQIGCELGQIVKSIAFMVDGNPVLVLACGDGMVDDKKLAKMFGVGRKKVKIAKPEQLIEIWGYIPGGVPPFGHRTPDIPTYLDTALQRFEAVYAAGGTPNTIFGITRAELEAKSHGTYADVRKDT